MRESPAFMNSISENSYVVARHDGRDYRRHSCALVNVEEVVPFDEHSCSITRLPSIQ